MGLVNWAAGEPERVTRSGLVRPVPDRARVTSSRCGRNAGCGIMVLAAKAGKYF